MTGHRAGLDHSDQPSGKARSKAHGSARRTSGTLTDWNAFEKGASATACGSSPMPTVHVEQRPGKPRSRAHVLWVYLQDPVFAPIG